MHGAVLDDHEADSDVADHARDEHDHVDDGDRHQDRHGHLQRTEGEKYVSDGKLGKIV